MTAAGLKDARLGMLVPASNTNAEPITAAVLSGIRGVDVFASRFQLPPSLDARIDLSTLGDSTRMIAQVAPNVVSFHGTAGSWTGIGRDAELARALAEATGASAGTTATQAMMAAMAALNVRAVSVVFPGSGSIVDGISTELGAYGITVVGRSTLPYDLGNPEIAALPTTEVLALLTGGARDGADAILCVGTNLRAGYLVDEVERTIGTPIIDSALAVTWHMLRLAGVQADISGWGRLLRDH